MIPAAKRGRSPMPPIPSRSSSAPPRQARRAGWRTAAAVHPVFRGMPLAPARVLQGPIAGLALAPSLSFPSHHISFIGKCIWAREQIQHSLIENSNPRGTHPRKSVKIFGGQQGTENEAYFCVKKMLVHSASELMNYHMPITVL